MDHILIEYSAKPVNLIWELAQRTWPHMPKLWPSINIRLILAGGILTTPKEENEQSDDEEDDKDKVKRKSIKQRTNRLLQILVSELAHLIWVLRCEHIINKCSHTAREIKSRWLKVINTRLIDNKIITTKVCCSKTSCKLVSNTWEKALQKDGPIPQDWIHPREVLVGRRVHIP